MRILNIEENADNSNTGNYNKKTDISANVKPLR